MFEMLSLPFRKLQQLLNPRHLCRGVYSFRLSVRPFVCSFVRSFVTFRHVRRIYLKVLVKVSLSEYISLTTHQKAFIFKPWVPERVIFYAMSLAPGFMPRGGAKNL